mgnify:CR=1 FL=1
MSNEVNFIFYFPIIKLKILRDNHYQATILGEGKNPLNAALFL